jgi:ATP-dependent DNA helicase RecQ
MAGVDTLAVMPTGAGKSLCYQLPAQLLPGVTVVVSPLLALMRDQVARAHAQGIAAVSLTSGDDAAARRAKLQALARGDVKLCYAAPEGLRSTVVLDVLRAAGVALLCVDEAHCISSWGHDFRADYARLGGLREVLNPRCVLALTATATPAVRQDILRALRMENAALLLTGFDRPNLALRVLPTRGEGAKRRALEEALREGLRAGGSAIVYCATRRETQRLAQHLGEWGFPSLAYHAGLPAARREEAQGAWERGEVAVMCATNAFGMGVDKPDVRVVVHHAMPRSPEAYYQEVGRAGRDGLPAMGVLLHDAQDVLRARQRVEAGTPGTDAVARAYAWCLGHMDDEGWLPAQDVVENHLERHVGRQARACVVHLLRLGVVTAGAFGPRVTGPDLASLDVRADLLEAHRHAEVTRLCAMEDYVRGARCRRAFLVSYFSRAAAPACGACDVCAQGTASPPSESQRVDALKVLSCVARLMGRFGRARVVDVLLGSRARPVLEARLDTLSTHGLMRGRPRAQLLALVDALERAGLLVSVGEDYPVMDLTDAGAHAMASGNVPPLRLEPATVPVAPAAEEPLLERLLAWRATTASAHHVPPYVLLQEKTLRAVCCLRPRTLLELRQVPGVGEARLARHGEVLLSLIRQG